MPQLRWTLLLLGVLFVILLAWIEHRRQRRQGFTNEPPVDNKEVGESSSPPMFREPILSLPEMRAARDPGPPHELPVVEIEEGSLDPRRLESGEGRAEPPTLSLPVLQSGPVTPRPRTGEPAVSSFDLVSDARAKTLGDTSSVGEGKTYRDANISGIPRLDTPAPKRTTLRSDLGDSEERAFNEAVFGGPALAAHPQPDTPVEDEDAAIDAPSESDSKSETESESDAGPEPDADDGASEAETSDADAELSAAQPRFTPADVTPIREPIVEWPPEDQRRVVALRLVAPPPERLAGRALRLALASEGFVLGKFQIFHKPDAGGRAVLSAASLSKPGTFELETMDSQRYGGLSLFAVLPGPKPPLKAFEDLLAAARNLNERLQGALQDERGGPLTPTRVASLRESLAAETTP
jgi:cell division protein ZipA